MEYETAKIIGGVGGCVLTVTSMVFREYNASRKLLRENPNMTYQELVREREEGMIPDPFFTVYARESGRGFAWVSVRGNTDSE